LIDDATVERGEYSLTAVFAAPGSYSWPLGINLEVYHICETSSFENAPVITPENYNYFVNQGDLTLTAAYDQDLISADPAYDVECGPFTLVVEFDSAELGSDLDAGTTIQATDDTTITFAST